MKTRFLLIGLLIGFNGIIAQTFDWGHGFGGMQGDFGTQTAIGKDGSYYIAGTFSSVMDMDPGPDSVVLSSNTWSLDVFVAKYDTLGNLLWAKQFGGIYEDEVYAIALDSNDNVYLTGFFRNSVDFDPGQGTYNLFSSIRSLYVLKLDAGGNFIWAKQSQGSIEERGYSLALDAAENIYVAGTFVGMADFDLDSTVFNINAVGDQDVFLLKLKPDGSFAWVKKFGGALRAVARSVKVDGNGNVIIGGFFKGTADFDPNVPVLSFTAMGNDDAFLVKLDSTGNLVWANQFGGAGAELVYALEVDGNDDIICLGSLVGTADFDPGTGVFQLTSTTNSSADGFMVKINAQGGFVFAKSIAGINYVFQTNIATDVNNNIYACGGFEGNVSFSPPNGFFQNAQGSQDGYIVKYNAAGKVQWVETIGGVGSDFARSVAVNSKGDLLLAGQFSNSCNLNPNQLPLNIVNSAGGTDGFVVKLDQCFVDSRITQSGAMLFSRANGVSYQWLDCQNNNAPIPGAVAKSYTPTNNGTFAVYVSNGTCSDTSDCVQVTNIGLEEIENRNVSVYPNPTTGLLELESSSEIIRIEVIDLAGRIVYQQVTHGKTLDISFLPPGSYVLKLTFDEFSLQKIVIKK
jgi:hypothetical protein